MSALVAASAPLALDLDLGDDPVLARFETDLEAQAPLDLDGVAAPDLATLDPAAVRAARRAWAGRVVDEHRSVVVFSELLRLLAERAAPFAAQVAVQRLIGDELRHVRLCGRMADLFGGLRGLALDLTDLGLPPSDAPPGARAYEVVVRELVIAEAESVLMLGAYRRASTEPVVRRAFDLLLADEARHVATGLRLEALLRATLPRDEVDPVREHLHELLEVDLAHMRSSYRAAAAGGPGRALGAALGPTDLPFADGDLTPSPAIRHMLVS